MEEQNNRVPRVLPVIHINNVVMYPYLMIPLIIADESLKKVIEYSLSNDKLLGFFLSKDVKKDGEVDIHEYGTAVSIVRMLRNQDGSVSLLLQGVSRIKIEKITQHHPYMMVEIEEIPEISDDTPHLRAVRKITTELLEKVISESSEFNKELIFGLKSIKQHSRVADIVSGNLPFSTEVKQDLLETLDINLRYEKLNKHLAELIKQMQLESTIRDNIQLEIDEDQKKYYLKEQLEAIKKELGETNEVDQEIQNWLKKITSADLPDYVYEAAKEELNKISMMSPASSEYSLIRNYLDWLLNIPWRILSEDRLDLHKIESILSHDHYGLEKVKERIIEFIAVKKLKDKLKGPILCFTGPPGVGKTSMGKSIARAMNRKFIRISLGGIHDEAEIRGHRRTYIGAMPGKIITEIKRCGTANPVFMLDEIDKVGKDFRGDPSSALLEVLDPEQNNSFMDNYINLPFDLSEVFFITTSNSLDTIPPALRDRMEIIDFSSYIEEEKIQIARKYLVPKELENNGISGKYAQIMTSALKEIIRFYVREAGVRTLQREIAKIMRKIARKVAEGDFKKNVITDKNIKDFLGRRKFSQELSGREPEVGIVTGLAWTVFGGEILFCETSKMTGKGKLILTGLLGEVMQESAKIALSYLKSNAEKYNLDFEIFEKNDLHIHLPAGAIPKDGPSAGVTLTTSIVSLLTNQKVRHDIAMTGEITLYGKVLPIGGVREKVLAAKRAGIKIVLLPFENQDSYEEIPEDIRQGIDAKFIKHVDEIFEIVLIKNSLKSK
ncbi:MAG: endopeptidase La [Candidatus Cloacimonetes bacterium]|nr:endopeptidase La [Candidatus Cloacimonadota bacterium]MDD4155422.1 endopeptidase La [Candidatus Cloacimonadota bacterium]